MKKILFALIIIILSNIYVNAQPQNSTNGGSFTPRGDLRVLLVCVDFGSQ